MEKVSFESGTPVIQKEYSIAPHMYDSSFKDYQRKFIFPINYIITAICAIIAIVGIILAVKKTMALIVLSLVFIVIAIIPWVNSTKVRKKFVQSMALVKDERLTAQFYDDGIIINKIPKGSTMAERNVIDFSKDEVKILDKRYYFIAYVNKSQFNIIPKKVFDATEETTLAKCFQKKLGNNYIK